MSRFTEAGGSAKGLPTEIIKKVKLLEISTRKIVNSLFAGQYHSAFKGQGMTFAEFREYVPGDDVRSISWPVTARTGKTYIKKFDEEREMIMILAVDISGSLSFGSGDYVKGEVVTHLAALLGFAAAKNNDHVGLLLFTDEVEHYVPPKKGRGHIQRILRDLYYFKPKRTGTKISAAVDHLQGVLKKRATIFFFSDFRESSGGAGVPGVGDGAGVGRRDSFATSLRLMSKRHDVVAVVVQDPAELALPKVGLIDLRDAETGATVTVDSSSPIFRRAYADYMKGITATREQEFRQAGVDRVEVLSGAEFVDPLISYFRKKNSRR
jgi:uncharacterized protein (DUF58 family)